MIIMTWASHTCFKGALSALALWSLAGAFPLCAGSVSGRVEFTRSQDSSARKRDYSGVVVWLEPLGAAAPSPVKPHRAEMIQKAKTFTPHVLPILVGTTVDFPNYDPIYHNAFSNYDGQIFDIGLYPPGGTRAIAFRREGVVRVFCNIHPAMSAVIVVLKSPYFSTSNRAGEFVIADVPAGSYRLHVFHERATEQTLDALTRSVEVGAGVLALPMISVSESGHLQLPHKNKYGRDYPQDVENGTYPGAHQ
jgi:plastocyanin